MAYLEVTGGNNTQGVFRVDGEVFIGRDPPDPVAPANFLHLPEPTVSRYHARIVCRAGLCFIEDHGSRNGTFLDGAKLEPGIPYRLQEGSVIQIAASRLVFHMEHRSGASASAELPGPATPLPDADLPHLPMPGQLEVSPDMANESRGQGPVAPGMTTSVDVKELMRQLQGAGLLKEGASQGILKRLQAMAGVSIALGAVTDREALAQKIMDYIFDLFPSAGRAFVMLREQGSGALVPVAFRQQEDDPRTVHGPQFSHTIVDWVLQTKRAILSYDSFSDQRLGAQASIVAQSIRSVMCVPLIVDNEVLGLIQVDTSVGPFAFTEGDLKLLTGVCAEMAVALKNFRLYEDIDNLLEGFVRASVLAIEKRDPVTAGHSFRVADYTERLARAVDRTGCYGLGDVKFTKEQLREIRYAALLHDFGKVGVREPILLKEKKLYPHQMALIEQRFKYAHACMEGMAYKRLIELHQTGRLGVAAFVTEMQKAQAWLREEGERLRRFLETIRAANEPTIEHVENPTVLAEVLQYEFGDFAGERSPLLYESEWSSLTLSKGSLSAEERKEIESHVSASYAFLNMIPWTDSLAAVPDIAHGHHEKLDGSGYPRGLRGNEISVQVRMLTIADIFDALTACDRPYKKALGVEEALDLMTRESAAGKIDGSLFKVFVESRAFELP